MLDQIKIVKKMEGNILSFDFGEKRIGIAIGNSITKTSHPLETINTDKNTERYRLIELLLKTWEPVKLVIGYPLNEDGTLSKMSLLAKKFGMKLGNKYNIPIVMIDERFTSSEADLELKKFEKNFKKRKIVIDQVAAMIILDSFFQNNINENSNEKFQEVL
ncbi:Holliday junction resolvase RuvX [Methylophilaceae bacterium]|jgi:putative Holliday junction resolvase|nr:Holliday junction resolvase RuvX [Methylophilaceae bacterium]